MDDLLLHNKTRQQLTRLVESRAHAILLIGPAGAGKQELLRRLSLQVLEASTLEHQPYYKELTPEGKSITIEQVRTLQRFLSLRTTGTKLIRRVISIPEAGTMTSEAQNAILKTLEEPPLDTMLLLGARQPDSLLPTVRSRVQMVHILPPEVAAAQRFFATQGYKPDTIQRAYALSGGSAGLMKSILQDDETSPLVKDIALAKELLQKPLFERLAAVDELAKQKEGVGNILLALKRICSGALKQAAQKDQGTAIKAWHARLTQVVQAEAAFARNANTKLLLTDLLLHL